MRDIKDYLHLYLGGGCQATYSGKSFQPHGVINTEKLYQVMIGVITDIKPILRPLSDMTEEEKEEFEELQYDDNVITLHKYGTIVQTYVPEIFRRMLQMQFDLFNLIPEGLAIDKTAK